MVKQGNLTRITPIPSDVATHTSVLVGTSTTKIADANEDRKYLIITNPSNQDIEIFLMPTADVTTEVGITISKNGGFWEMSTNIYIGEISAVTSFIASTILVVEY